MVWLKDSGRYEILHTSKEFGLVHKGLEDRGKTYLDLSLLIKDEL